MKNAYLQRVYDQVVSRDPAEHEFHQCIREFLESLEGIVDEHPEWEENGILERFVEPDRMISFRVTWVDDAGRVDALTRQVTVETELPVTGDVEVLVRSQVTDRSALPAANGLELRLGVAFQILLLGQTEQLGIAGLTAEENASMDAGERPSIVLRQMAAGETLWDIAKAYQTTVSEIQQANDMEDQPAEPGVLLLIPRMR